MTDHAEAKDDGSEELEVSHCLLSALHDGIDEVHERRNDHHTT